MSLEAQGDPPRVSTTEVHLSIDAGGLSTGQRQDGPQSTLELAVSFLRVGALSFGGGTATILMLRHELVDRRKWLTTAEFNRGWTLSKLAPGINLIAQVILYARDFAGVPGVIVAVAGFLFPSVVATIAFSALLVTMASNPVAHAALRFVVPVTGGMTVAMAIQLWNPTMRPRRLFGAEAFVVVLSALLVGVAQAPVPVVMLVAIITGALLPL